MTIDSMLHIAMEHYKEGQIPEAERLCRHILVQAPGNSYAWHLLGVLAGEVGRAALAVEYVEKAIALHPGEAFFHCNLSAYYIDVGRFEQAAKEAQKALKLAPTVANSYYNLGIALQGLDRQEEALLAYRKALELKRDYPQAYANLANIHKDRGQITQAIALLRLAVRFGEHLPMAHSNLVYCLLMHPDYTTAHLRQELSAWNQQHAAPLRSAILPHTNDKNPDRPLRIGYVSPDFREHVIGFNMLPLMQNHHKDQFATYVYSDVAESDAVTEQFRTLATEWRPVASLNDDAIARQIREDQIDILVDLSLHLNGNRLLVFARKPAPVQVTFAGYPGSTGVETIDYRLSDPYLDPPGKSDADYSEKTVCLPHSFWCYAPASEQPAVNELPAVTGRGITFGCLNNFCKVHDGVLRLWAEVLKQVPGSRLLVLAPQGPHRQYTQAFLAQEAITPDRLEFVGILPHDQYLQQYHRIDICLDTFPYNGHTTSLDSTFMGVPVVTLVGKTVVGCAGYSQLMNLGLPELIAQSPEQFVQIATSLAGDLPRLAELRRTLRPRLQESPLGDAAGFAGGIEAAYRQMWRTWCAAR